MGFNIAIDGPAGAGKSTIAKQLSEKMSFLYVDTGAMYRAMACYFLTHHISSSQEEDLQKACERIAVSLSYVDGKQRVLLNGEDVTDQIRTEEVGNMASSTSGYPFVRAKLLDLQRKMAAEHDVIMDGRDIGTAILPNANLKIYLTASTEARAQRRYLELLEKGQNPDLAVIRKDIEERDYRDMHREISPLKAADDAVILDSSDMGITEVVEAIYDLAIQAGFQTEKQNGEA